MSPMVKAELHTSSEWETVLVGFPGLSWGKPAGIQLHFPAEKTTQCVAAFSKNKKKVGGGGEHSSLSLPQDRTGHTLWKSSPVQRVQSGCGQNLERLYIFLLPSSKNMFGH